MYINIQNYMQVCIFNQSWREKKRLDEAISRSATKKKIFLSRAENSIENGNENKFGL